MSETQELIRLLKSLKTTAVIPRHEYMKEIRTVERVLETIFKIHITKTVLSTDEKKIIGPLIAGSLFSIGEWVSYSVEEFEDPYIGFFEITRSGLQFLLDAYQELDDGSNSCLGEYFEDFKAREDIEGWDEQFKGVSESYDPNYFDQPTLNAEEQLQVPESHWWWGFGSGGTEE